MRAYLYILAGITSGLLGWNIGQLFLCDCGILKSFPEIVLFPCVAISLAVGSVANEIFVSNPTRPKLNLRIVRIPLLIALGVGLVSGLVAGGISQILFAPQIKVSAVIVRVFGWLVVGASVGFAEGFSWRWHSMEAGDPKRFRTRLFLSVFAASVASLVAAGLFELVRQFLGTMPPEFKSYEDPIGFAVLGFCLGTTFAITNASPSYLPALRAGKGFEYKGEDYGLYSNLDYPRINPDKYAAELKFISYRSQSRFQEESALQQVEEGLSIKLPKQGRLHVGSAEKTSHIFLPRIPLHVADIEIKGKEAKLYPNPRFYNKVAVNGQRLPAQRDTSLKHNDVLTFFTLDDDDDDAEAAKYYRMVFYNRFFDPMA